MPSNEKTLNNTIKNSFFLTYLTQILSRTDCNSYQEILSNFKRSDLPIVELKDELSLQLILAYDRCRTTFSTDNIQHWACTYIRAHNLSGTCKWVREFLRSSKRSEMIKFASKQKCCVRRMTVERLKLENPTLATEQIESTVDSVFDRCYNDYEPFWHPVAD